MQSRSHDGHRGSRTDIPEETFQMNVVFFLSYTTENGRFWPRTWGGKGGGSC